MKSEITVAIISRNRSEFIRDTIRSFLKQTYPAARIVVLDNASDRETVSAIEDFKQHGVVLDRTANLISVADNIRRAGTHADTGWIMIAHDDDIYHPEYLERVARAIAERPDVGLVVSRMSYDHSPTLHFRYGFLDCPAHYVDAAGLAAAMFAGEAINFGASVYRLDVFNRTELEWEKYANILDRPFLLRCADHGGAIILKGKGVKYRLHDGQAVKNEAAQLPLKHVINLVGEYRRRLHVGVSISPNPYTYGALYRLYAVFRNGGRNPAVCLQCVHDTGLLSAKDWLFGIMFFPWYLARSWAAKTWYTLQGRIAHRA